MSRTIKRLRAYGYTNHDSEDLGAIAYGVRKELRAYCTSDACNDRKNSKGKSLQVHERKIWKQNVKRSAERCPDCGDYLFWKWTKVDSKIHLSHGITQENSASDLSKNQSKESITS